MGNSQSNSVHLELENTAHYPGAVVYGKLHVDIVSECKLDEIKLKVQGYELVDWAEDKSKRVRAGISLRDLTVQDRHNLMIRDREYEAQLKALDKKYRFRSSTSSFVQLKRMSKEDAA